MCCLLFGTRHNRRTSVVPVGTRMGDFNSEDVGVGKLRDRNFTIKVQPSGDIRSQGGDHV